MKTKKRKAGSSMLLKIKRSDGSIEDFGLIHNILASNIQEASRLSLLARDIGFGARSDYIYEDLPGTFSQSETSIARQSGSYVFSGTNTNDLLVFSSGEKAYKLSGTGSTAGASKSQTVTTTTLRRYKTGTSGFGSSPSSNIGYNSSVVSTIGTYSNGVVSRTALDVEFPVASSTLNINSIVTSITGMGTFLFHIPSTIVLNAGDRLVIDNWTYNAEFDDYQPRYFATLPISGITASGRMQRLTSAVGMESNSTSSIILVNNANKITVPDMSGPTYTTPVVAMETLVTTDVSVSPTYSNNGFSSKTVSGTVVTGGDVKQILIKANSSSSYYWVIEFDTPQNIPAGKVLSFTSSLAIDFYAAPPPP